jgi:hypothetical protein
LLAFKSSGIRVAHECLIQCHAGDSSPFPAFPTFLSPPLLSLFFLPPNSTHQPAGLSSALSLFQMTINPNSRWSRQCNTEYSENNKEERAYPRKSGTLPCRTALCLCGRTAPCAVERPGERSYPAAKQRPSRHNGTLPGPAHPVYIYVRLEPGVSDNACFRVAFILVFRACWPRYFPGVSSPGLALGCLRSLSSCLHVLLAPHTSGPRVVPRCGALSLL